MSPLQTFIDAIKEFICTYTCIECRKQINPGTYMDSPTITCPTCSTIFLKENSNLTNHCMFRLTNKQWYSANTGVSKLHIKSNSFKIKEKQTKEAFSIQFQNVSHNCSASLPLPLNFLTTIPQSQHSFYFQAIQHLFSWQTPKIKAHRARCHQPSQYKVHLTTGSGQKNH